MTVFSAYVSPIQMKPVVDGNLEIYRVIHVYGSEVNDKATLVSVLAGRTQDGGVMTFDDKEFAERAVDALKEIGFEVEENKRIKFLSTYDPQVATVMTGAFNVYPTPTTKENK